MSLSFYHPSLVIVVPLAFAALCPILGSIRRSLCYPWAVAGSLATAFFVWSLAGKVTSTSPIIGNLGGWPPPWGIQLRIDVPGLFLACAVVSVVALMVVYSYRTAASLEGSRPVYYYSLVLLALSGMLGFIVTNDLFTMFLTLEIFTVSAAALVAISKGRAAMRAGFRYLVAASAAGAGFLLALAMLYSVTGTLDMRKVAVRITSMDPRYLAVAATGMVLFLLALAVKSAFFPFQWWLGDASALSSIPVGALLAGAVICVTSLGMFRILYIAYGFDFSSLSWSWNAAVNTVSWIAAAAILACCGLTLVSADLRYIAAYAAAAQIAMTWMGAGTGRANGVAGGIYMPLACVCGTACLFAAAGSYSLRIGTCRIRDLGGAGRRMPVTSTAFVLGSLCVAGVPLTAGYTARKLLFQGCLDGSQYVQAAVVVLGSALLFVCFARIWWVLFFGEENTRAGLTEAPAEMLAPNVILAIGAVVLGILGPQITPALVKAAGFLIPV